MSKYNELKSRYFNLLSLNSSVFEWLTEDTLWGFCVLDPDFPDRSWVNDALIKNLGFALTKKSVKTVNSQISTKLKDKIQNLKAGVVDDKVEFQDDVVFEKQNGAAVTLKITGKTLSVSKEEDIIILKFKEDLFYYH